MPSIQSLEWDIWYWIQGVMNELLLPPEYHGWTTAGLMLSTMFISMIVYDFVMFLMDLAAVSTTGHGAVTTSIMGGRQRPVHGPLQDLAAYRSAETTNRVLRAIEDDRYRGRPLQVPRGSGGLGGWGASNPAATKH